MHIVIAGGTGFLGKRLVEKLVEHQHQVTILTRNPERHISTSAIRYVRWLTSGSSPETELDQVDAIVNLAGDSISGLRWTKKKKQRILESRLQATHEIIRLIKGLDQKPHVLVNASAVGYYGMSETNTYTESSESEAQDFLANVVRKWEQAALEAEEIGVRTVLARFGVILGSGGALSPMVLPYTLWVGGTLGTGRQWLSWIHLDDAVGLLKVAIEEEQLSGPLNVTAPKPVRMKEFGQTIGNVIHRPHWLPLPSFAMNILLGEMSQMMLQGQQALPKKAKSIYTFAYPTLEQALTNILADQ